MNNKTSLIRQLILSAVVVVVFATLGLILNGRAQTEKEQKPAAPKSDKISVDPEGAKAANIRVSPVISKTIQETIHTTGQVLYSPDYTVKIAPRLQGRVKTVLVKVGDPVVAGQTLAVLDSIDAATARNTDKINETALALAKLNLDRVQKQFDLGTPEVTQAQAALDQAKTAETWAKDAYDKMMLQAKIGGFTQKPVEDAENALVAAKTSLQQAEVDLTLAQKDYDRKVKLVNIGVAATSDLEISQDTLEKARVSVNAGKETVRLAQQALDREQKAYNTNLYADQQVNQSHAAYEQAVLQRQAAERALLLTKAAIKTALDQARSDYRTAQLNAQNSKQALELLGQPSADGTLIIKSPISGVVTERFIAPGQVVDQSQSTPWQLFTIANADRVWVEGDIYEKDLAAVGEGMPVQIHVGALPNQVFYGKVLHIAPTLDKTSRSIKVRAEIDNHTGQLKDGMYANVDIQLPQGRPVTVVPLSAVQHSEDSDFVFVADNGKFIKRLIHLGEQKDGNGVVESGLQPGERIVVNGAIYLGIDTGSGD